MDNLTINSINSPWPFDYENPPKFVPFWFENVNTFRWKEMMIRNPNVGWYACAVYLTVVFALQSYMKDRPAVNVRKVMVVWNTFLTIFSAFGFYRIAQELLFNIFQPDGYYRSVCVREGRNLPADFWGMLFVLSKFFELGDTIFIVLRKQPLIALQWYHHSVVTLFAWKLYPWGEPILSYYAAINYGVHSVMYCYFAARGLNLRIPEPLAMSITTLQISQMIINTGNNFYTMAMLYFGHSCSRHPTSITWSLFVYISLWILFAKFFLGRYFSKKGAHIKVK
ncbi:elongation of very long chain fatty acids protein 6-like [Folsomia candida]|uniref:elongation of very long chain fatty acids protein 6-like n=1 Tax=Folsomia candida TaxID=158441 RepID=UPI001604D73D|nr:elongation of very long chain fatty acids protein 6-like [Folsomia candida]